jgi:hypothetical protein
MKVLWDPNKRAESFKTKMQWQWVMADARLYPGRRLCVMTPKPIPEESPVELFPGEAYSPSEHDAMITLRNGSTIRIARNALDTNLVAEDPPEVLAEEDGVRLERLGSTKARLVLGGRTFLLEAIGADYLDIIETP